MLFKSTFVTLELNDMSVCVIHHKNKHLSRSRIQKSINVFKMQITNKSYQLRKVLIICFNDTLSNCCIFGRETDHTLYLKRNIFKSGRKSVL